MYFLSFFCSHIDPYFRSIQNWFTCKCHLHLRWIFEWLIISNILYFAGFNWSRAIGGMHVCEWRLWRFNLRSRVSEAIKLCGKPYTWWCSPWWQGLYDTRHMCDQGCNARNTTIPRSPREIHKRRTSKNQTDRKVKNTRGKIYWEDEKIQDYFWDNSTHVNTSPVADRIRNVLPCELSRAFSKIIMMIVIELGNCSSPLTRPFEMNGKMISNKEYLVHSIKSKEIRMNQLL